MNPEIMLETRIHCVDARNQSITLFLMKCQNVIRGTTQLLHMVLDKLLLKGSREGWQLATESDIPQVKLSGSMEVAALAGI